MADPRDHAWRGLSLRLAPDLTLERPFLLVTALHGVPRDGITELFLTVIADVPTPFVLEARDHDGPRPSPTAETPVTFNTVWADDTTFLE